MQEQIDYLTRIRNLAGEAFTRGEFGDPDSTAAYDNYKNAIKGVEAEIARLKKSKGELDRKMGEGTEKWQNLQGQIEGLRRDSGIKVAGPKIDTSGVQTGLDRMIATSGASGQRIRANLLKAFGPISRVQAFDKLKNEMTAAEREVAFGTDNIDAILRAAFGVAPSQRWRKNAQGEWVAVKTGVAGAVRSTNSTASTALSTTPSTNWFDGIMGLISRVRAALATPFRAVVNWISRGKDSAKAPS